MATYSAWVQNDDGEITWDSLKLSEQHIYGSARVGLALPGVKLFPEIPANPHACGSCLYPIFEGRKHYEITNHLGNVQAVITDRKRGNAASGTEIQWFDADVVSAQQYYPFGMLMPGHASASLRRQYSLGGVDYRFGFNGKEGDDEVKGDDNQQDYGMRIYDPRAGRFLSVDPLAKSFPWNSTYAFSEGSPIANVDLDGLERYFAADGRFLGVSGSSKDIRIIGNYQIFDRAKENLSHPNWDHSWLLEKSKIAYENTEENQKLVFKAWAQKWAKWTADDNYQRERVMSIFTKTMTDEEGNPLSVFSEGSSASGLYRAPLARPDDSGLFIDNIDVSRWYGWNRSTTIHTHPNKGTTTDFSDDKNDIFSRDIQWSLRKNIKILVTMHNMEHVKMFDPSIYNKLLPNWRTNNPTDEEHEKARRASQDDKYINKNKD